MDRPPRPALRRFSLALTGYCGLLAPLAGGAETFDTLPPPPALAPGQTRQRHMLELVVNDFDSGRIVPVAFDNGHYLLRSADLAQAGLPTDQLAAVETDVTAMAQVNVIYDRQRRLLKLTVPPEWLPQQTFTGAPGSPRHEGLTSTGALLNYDIYGSRINRGATRVAVWNEWRAFGRFGHFSTDGVIEQPLSGTGSAAKDYIRYDTYWADQEEDSALSWKVGDVITNALSWSGSVRIGGIQIARDFALRPDLVTYPLPSFAGRAAVPATVDLFVDGYRAGSNEVRPGPYAFNNLPFINGAGEAVVVATDALGRRVTTTQPFYISSSLLKPGLPDYSLAAGALRRAYGLRNADYAIPVASGSYRQGINDGWTLESHAEGAQSLALAGAGSLYKLGRWGVANGAVTHSRTYGDHGGQYDWGYDYNNRYFSLGMRHTVRSGRFGNLTILDSGAHHMSDALWTLNRRSGQYYASLSLEPYGSVGATYIDIRTAAGETIRLWNASWSRSLWRESSLFITATYDPRQRDCSGAVSLVIPFGGRASASAGLERDRPGGTAQRVSVTHAMPSDGGFSWDLSYARRQRESDYRQATLNWRNAHLKTSAGLYGYGGSGTLWGDMNGALVLMDGHLLAADQLSNAFALVKTDYPDIPVRYENQLVGSTNEQGYLLVPGISAYYPAKYDIDTRALPLDLSVENVEQRVAVRRRSGYLLHFPIEPLRAAAIILHDQQGQPLPAGSRILRDGQSIEYVGWDGTAWVDNLGAENSLRAVTPDGRRCTAFLALPGGKPRPLQTYGPLTCPLSPLP